MIGVSLNEKVFRMMFGILLGFFVFFSLIDCKVILVFCVVINRLVGILDMFIGILSILLIVRGLNVDVRL